MADKSKAEKTQDETTREQANDLPEDGGFSPDPVIGGQVGGKDAAEDTHTDGHGR